MPKSGSMAFCKNTAYYKYACSSLVYIALSAISPLGAFSVRRCKSFYP